MPRSSFRSQPGFLRTVKEKTPPLQCQKANEIFVLFAEMQLLQTNHNIGLRRRFKAPISSEARVRKLSKRLSAVRCQARYTWYKAQCSQQEGGLAHSCAQGRTQACRHGAGIWRGSRRCEQQCFYYDGLLFGCHWCVPWRAKQPSVPCIPSGYTLVY